MSMTFGSLFSGIGGIDLGLERAGMTCAWQCEIDPYCRAVLNKHWPNVTCWDDIRRVNGRDLPPVDLICGGPPCQPASFAGKRKGSSDDRWMWPDFLQIVQKSKPLWVLAENVLGFIDCQPVGLSWYLDEMEKNGYESVCHVFGAGHIGAHFEGKRVYAVSRRPSSISLRREGVWSVSSRQNWGRQEFERLVLEARQVAISAGIRGGISDGVSQRVDKLRSLGNAVVPQCAEVIGRAIMECCQQCTE